MSSDTPRSNRTEPSTDTDDRPNVITVVGMGIPSSYEITVDGTIEPAPDHPERSRATVSGSAVEGSVDVGIARFRFSGDLTSVNFVGRGDRYEPGSPYVPRVSVDYNVGR